MARGFNKAIIVGNLTRDPEIRYTASGTAVARLSVAVNRQWRGQNGETHEEVDFIPVVVWGSQAENCDRYLRKGRPLLVEGRISVRNYEGRDGQKRYVTEIVAQTVQFLGSGRRDDEGGFEGSYRQGGASGNAPQRSGEAPDRSGSGAHQPSQGGAKSFRDGGFSEDFPLDFSEVGDGNSSGFGSDDDDEDIPF